MQTSTLKKRVLHASLWTFGGSFLNQLIRFCSNLMMTRLLMPEMFGLMAVANVFIFGLGLFSDVGLNQSLIQNKRTDSAFINTIWTIQVLRGCLIWLISILIAIILMVLAQYNVWPKSSVYTEPLLPYILIVIGFNAVINGFESTKLIINSRNISLKRNVMISIFSQLSGIAGMLIWVSFQRSVWALVVGAIVTSIVQMTSSHLLIQGQDNKIHWDEQVFKEVMHFGKWVFIGSILGFLLVSSDRLLLGALVDTNTLGLYTIAFYLFSAIRDLFGNIMHRVGFAAMSETFRNNPAELKKVFYKLRLPFDLTLIFLAVFIFASGQDIVKLLYDNRYVSSGWMLEILALSLFEQRYKMAAELYMSIGKPRINTTLILLNLFVLYTFGLLAFYLFGLKGIIWVVGCAAMLIIPVHVYFLSKFEVFDWKSELKVLPIAIVGYAASLFFKHILGYLTLLRHSW